MYGNYRTIEYIESQFADSLPSQPEEDFEGYEDEYNGGEEEMPDDDDFKKWREYLVKEYNKAKPQSTYSEHPDTYPKGGEYIRALKEMKTTDKFKEYVSLKSEPYKGDKVDDLGLDAETRERLNRWVNRRVSRLEKEVNHYRDAAGRVHETNTQLLQELSRAKDEIARLKKTGIFPLEKKTGANSMVVVKSRIDLTDLIMGDE